MKYEHLYFYRNILGIPNNHTPFLLGDIRNEDNVRLFVCHSRLYQIDQEWDDQLKDDAFLVVSLPYSALFQ
ncbi:hypothetical protein NLX69_01065 [Rossellomorea sp. BNER]|nr:hypothetical protein [Rossellomorea sp. BNER]